MSKQKTQITALSLPLTGSEATSNFSRLIKKYLFHWPLFVLCCILGIGLAIGYLSIANFIYPVSSTIEFKSPTASSASLTVNQSTTEQTLDPIAKPVIVENEVQVMQSSRIIREVVDSLQLWATYSQKKGLLLHDLYKQTPVRINLIKAPVSYGNSGIKIDFKINDRNSFTYTDENGHDKKAKFSTPIKNVYGTWELVPTANLSMFVDSTMEVEMDDPDLVVESYIKGVKIELQDKDAPFVDLSMLDIIPARGKDILNDIMSFYLKYALDDKNRLSQKTLRFIDYRLDSLKNDLDSVERKIEVYKKAHNITFSVDTEAVSQENIKLQNTLAANTASVQLSIVSALEKYANSTSNSDKLPVSSTLLTDVDLSTLYGKLSDLRSQREQLLTELPETNPKIVGIDKQIGLLKADFRDKLVNLKSSLNSQKRTLDSIARGIQSYLSTVPTQDKELNALKRYQLSKETVYKFLLDKREEVSLRYASTASDSEIVDYAYTGKHKWPLIPVVLILGLFLGIGVAALMLYLRENLNDLIISRNQIEEEAQVPIIGELSYQDSDQQIVVSEGRSKFAIGEQFRVLRTNLYHLHSNTNSGRVTLFTSSVSGEGKSFVSSNLAVTLAYASRKTVILEMDLRKPKVSVNFGLSAEHIGISDYLSGSESDLQKLIQPSGFEGLDILSCGTILPNPSELLERDKLDQLIESLKQTYDEIIIDSPPIHLVTDSLIIARVVDASLYVVRQSYTHKHELEFINEINESKRFPKLAIVFNGIKHGVSSDYSGYGYGYSYSYGKSYYNSYAEKQKTPFISRLKEFGKRF